MSFRISKADEKEYNASHPITAPDGFNGPSEKRHGTDRLFALALILGWVVMTAMGLDAVENGRTPFILINGIDEKGRVCGVDAGVDNEPNWYPVRITGIGVCQKSCPKETIKAKNESDIADLICVSDLKNQTDREDYVDNNCPSILTKNFIPGSCLCNWQLKSISFVHRCLVTDDEYLDVMKDADNNANDANPFEEFIADILTTRTYIFTIGLAGSLAISFVFAWLMHFACIAHFLVWGCIFAVGGLLTLVAYLMWTEAESWTDEDPPEHSDEETKVMRIIAIVFVSVAVLYWCLMLFMRSRIELAVKLVELAAEAIVDMSALSLLPIVQGIGLVLFLVPWVFWVLFTATLGEMHVKEVGDIQTRTFTYSEDVVKRGIYFLFILLWTANFIVATGQLCISLAVSTWYFAGAEEKGERTVGNATVWHSLRIAIRYHMGTCAYGALILAIIQTIRAIVYYFERKARKADNKLGECILKMIQCCLCCLEKCVRWVNRHAYIQTAIFGYSFCKACRSAFFLIARNILRVGAVSVVSEFVLLIGRVFVVVTTGAVTYYIVSTEFSSRLYSPVGPTLFAMALAYLVASYFMEIFSMAIDCLLQCYVADEEMNDGEAVHAKAHFDSFVDTHGKPDPAEHELVEFVPPESRGSVASTEDVEITPMPDRRASASI